MMDLSILTLNVRGLRSRVRRLALYSYLISMGVQVICLQECSLNSAGDSEEWEKDWTFGQSVWSYGNESRSVGVGILCTNRELSLHRVEVVYPGRALKVKVEYGNLCVDILNIYASPYKRDREALFTMLPFFMSRNGLFLCMGDFNTILQARGRKRKRGESTIDITSRLLGDLCHDFQLVDVWATLNTSDPGYTWANVNTKSRIDFVFSSRKFCPAKAILVDNAFSDHKILLSTLSIPSVGSRGKGVWKLNISMLQEERVTHSFVSFYRKLRKEQVNFSSCFTWWSYAKTQIKKFFLNWGMTMGSERRKIYNDLLEHLQLLFRLRNYGVLVDDNIAETKRKLKGRVYDIGKKNHLPE